MSNDIEKIKLFSHKTPWVWSIEFVRGCNLKCWHCTARIFPSDGKPQFMSVETFTKICEVMAKCTPRRRLELAQGGEPTLHPQLLDCLKIARKITPTTQIQVTTNGVNLLNNKITFKQLFDAGAHSVYVDMYGSIDKFIELAKEANVEWYKYDKSKKLASSKTHYMANTYYGDENMKLIILQDNPEYRLKWRKDGKLSTFLNHIDWKESIQYGLTPVRVPYQRRCTLPLRYVSTSVDGDYLFCCIDFFCESASQLGNVSTGENGFKEFWFGKLMQSIRKHLREGNRKNIPYCSRCNCAFSKCDFSNIWSKEAYDFYFENGEWKSLPESNFDTGVFLDGWEWHKKTTAKLPSLEEEKDILKSSTKRIIYSDIVANKLKKEKIVNHNYQFFLYES